MKTGLTFLVLLLLSQGYGVAQSNRITGTITGTNNEAIPGANVLVRGTSQGTTSDVNGNFSITAGPNATLVISYIGYVSQTVEVKNRSVVNVQLVSDSQNLNEVVVTALGIRREAKTLGYATATVNADQINVNRTPNFANGLQGKLAGVNITPITSGPAGTAKIRIRGQSSFAGQNNPLIVVNGVPIDNSNYSLGGDYGAQASNSSDGGDGLSSINPDDIEEMTVLKGATAAALYGSRAKDGVVMITTKSRGSGKGFGVTYNVNFTTDTPLDFTDFRYEYGQGEGGKRPTTPNPTIPGRHGGLG